MIRRALFQKLAALPEWMEFRGDFEAATGMKLELVDELGQGLGVRECSDQAVCAAVAASHRGEFFCERFRQGLLQRGTAAAACGTCDAGLNEVVVPLRVGGTTVGYFLFGPFRSGPVAERDWHRARHLLERAGIPLEARALRSGLESAREVAPRAVQAYIHFVEMAVQRMAERLTAQLVPAQDRVPDAVARACALIRSEGLVGDLGLAEAARRCGVSEGHLSRAFHHATGLTFREYLARTRAEQARELLRDPRRNITEVAFAAGFQSISQFHRVFRKVFGVAPGEMRRGWRRAGGQPAARPPA